MIAILTNRGSEWHIWVNEKQITYFYVPIEKGYVDIHFTDNSTLNLQVDDAEVKKSLIKRLTKK